MRIRLLLLCILFGILSCENRGLEDYRKDLQSDDTNTLCIASFQVGQAKDRPSVPWLLKGIYDVRISHDLRHKGMSVYYCKAVALKKISGLDITVQQHQPPDSSVVNQLVEWALQEKLIKSVDQISLSRY